MPGNTSLLDILPLCSAEQLGLQGLACLAASSKQLRTISLGSLPKDGSMLLPALSAAARAKTAAAASREGAVARTAQARISASRAEQELQQRLQAFKWLLHQTPKAAAAAGVADRALQIPALPLQCAKQLLAAGMTITYAQLLHAADSMVAGLEVWVQAQHRLGLRTDIPTAAIEICCQGCRVSWLSTLQR
jgi:hypothetical protein